MVSVNKKLQNSKLLNYKKIIYISLRQALEKSIFCMRRTIRDLLEKLINHHIRAHLN